jgi:predicted dehydrogenase
MSSDTIRIGMIGCGGNARGHMGRLLGIKGVQIVGLCDTAAASLKASVDSHAKLARVPQFADYREMLGEVEMDAVEISTPHTAHYDQIMDSLDKGLHVLTEKPMVCKVTHAKRVLELQKRKRKVVGIAYQRHFMGPYRFCRELLKSKKLGKINFISALQSQDWLPNALTRWRGIPELSGGGQLNDSGSHLLDIILWMTDLEPAEIFAFVDNLTARVDILSSISARFRTGALCNISVVGHAVDWHEDISIWCDKGSLYIRGSEVTVADQSGQRVADLSGQRNWDPDTNFLDAIRKKDEVQAPPLCGLRTIQLTEAVWKSAATGAPVKVKA